MNDAPFHFDRYINSILMAEGVCVERATTLPQAMIVAARIASKGPSGETPVLVYRPLSDLCITRADADAMLAAERAIWTRAIETYFDATAVMDVERHVAVIRAIIAKEGEA